MQVHGSCTYSSIVLLLLKLFHFFLDGKNSIVEFSHFRTVRFGSVSRSLFGRTTEITEMANFGRTEKPNRSSVAHYLKVLIRLYMERESSGLPWPVCVYVLFCGESPFELIKDDGAHFQLENDALCHAQHQQ